MRLVVPLRALDRLRESCPLPLQLQRSEHALTLAHEDCSLSFRREGELAQLSDARIRSDARGTFFRDVLCALMTAHSGDLHAKLAWRNPEEDDSLGSAEVRIRRGQAEPGVSPALRNVVDNLREAAQPLFEGTPAGATQGQGSPQGQGAPAQQAAGQPPEPVDPELLSEVERLLEDARRHYAEYLRLRRSRTGR